MSKKITWTHKLRVRFYELVVEEFGAYVPELFNSRGKLNFITKAEFIEALDDIGITLGVGTDKGGALSNQLAWVFCVPSENCHQGHWNNRAYNVAAAREAGFIETPTPCTLVDTGIGKAIEPVTVDTSESEVTAESLQEEVGWFIKAVRATKAMFGFK